MTEPTKAKPVELGPSLAMRGAHVGLRAITWTLGAAWWLLLGMCGAVIAVCTLGASRAKRKR